MNDKLHEDPVINKQLQFVEWLKENGMYNEWASSTQMQSMHIVWEKLYTPKHETVEQWESREGKTYPNDGPVWVKSRYYRYMEDLTCSWSKWFYEIVKYENVGYLKEHLIDEIDDADEPEVILLCISNHHGQPPSEGK